MHKMTAEKIPTREIADVIRNYAYDILGDGQDLSNIHDDPTDFDNLVDLTCDHFNVALLPDGTIKTYTQLIKYIKGIAVQNYEEAVVADIEYS